MWFALLDSAFVESVVVVGISLLLLALQGYGLLECSVPSSAFLVFALADSVLIGSALSGYGLLGSSLLGSGLLGPSQFSVLGSALLVSVSQGFLLICFALLEFAPQGSVF